MGQIRIYTATSADGFIADREGGVDWLADFNPAIYGFDTFIGQVGAIVLGRRTYEYTMAFDDWPYADKQAFIVTSHELKNLPPHAKAVRGGLAATLAMARAATDGDIWIVGGAATMRSALELGAVDCIELFLVPTLVGDGISLVGALSAPVALALDSIETFADGVVKLTYHPRRQAAAPRPA